MDGGLFAQPSLRWSKLTTRGLSHIWHPPASLLLVDVEALGDDRQPLVSRISGDMVEVYTTSNATSFACITDLNAVASPMTLPMRFTALAGMILPG